MLKLADTDQINLFKQVLRHSNAMTPDILNYYQSDNLVAELSSGKDWNNKKMFGVSVVDIRALERVRDLCECFNSKSEALNHIRNL